MSIVTELVQHFAYHVASRAVVAAALECSVNSEGIEIAGVGEGQRNYADLRLIKDMNGRVRLDIALCISLGGWLAECRLSPDQTSPLTDDDLMYILSKLDGENDPMDGDAFDAMLRLKQEYPEAPDETLLARYRDFEGQTLHLIDGLWPHIETLAEKLLEKGKLSAGAVYMVMCRNGRFP